VSWDAANSEDTKAVTVGISPGMGRGLKGAALGRMAPGRRVDRPFGVLAVASVATGIAVPRRPLACPSKRPRSMASPHLESQNRSVRSMCT
jgi:hypothetical protein